MPYQAARLEELAPADREIVAAIGSQAEWMTGFLGKLVAAPTTLGNEEPGQVLVSQALREIGLDPTDVPMEAGAIRAHPGHSPFDWDVSNKRNVVAVWEPAEVDGAGRSLILNGHVDVVSPEPLGQWSQNPFEPRIRDGWLIGRGASDMKCGLAAIVGAVRGLRQLGLSPKAPVTIQSVVEEEITGNGTLQCVLAGHSADAAIVTEPFGAAITTSQVGVLWFRVRITGVAGHAAESSLAVNAIEKSLSMIEALRQLEAELNASAPPPYDRFERPIGLNVGTIAGGDWPSTVPGECVTEYRIAFYPGMSVRDIKDRIEAAVAEAAVNDPAIFAHPPEVEYRGFAAPGYEIPEDHPLVSSLAAAFARHVGNPPALVATTGTTDARILGLYGGVPAVCFGPYAQLGHGVDERAYLPSMVQTAQVLGLFIKDWCGLSG
jgi:acetylornithine deacetylase